MPKVTPRRLSSLESGEGITVKFTRVQGKRGGQHVTHEGEIAAVKSSAFTYRVGGSTFTLEIDTGYVREDGGVIGRDGSAKTQ